VFLYSAPSPSGLTPLSLHDALPIFTNTADPLAGSYFVERLTLDMEKGCWEYFERLDGMGGMVAAIENGFPQREIQDASYEYQKRSEEHTSELLSRFDLVCRLLLEKK